VTLVRQSCLTQRASILHPASRRRRIRYGRTACGATSSFFQLAYTDGAAIASIAACGLFVNKLTDVRGERSCSARYIYRPSSCDLRCLQHPCHFRFHRQQQHLIIPKRRIGTQHGTSTSSFTHRRHTPHSTSIMSVPGKPFVGLVAPSDKRPRSAFFGKFGSLSLIRDNFTLTTWLCFGAVIQSGLFLVLGRPAVLPALAFLAYRSLRAYAMSVGWIHDVYMDDIARRLPRSSQTLRENSLVSPRMTRSWCS